MAESPWFENSIASVRAGTARATVVGCGYVGLTLAVEHARAGLRVVGIETNELRAKELRAGTNPVPDVFVGDEELARLRDDGNLIFETSLRSAADVYVICVNTPLRDGSPDLRYIESAGEAVATVLAPGSLVVLESTTYPGTTDELVRPVLEEKGLKAGVDFHLAFSPERVDPGNTNYQTRNIPKVVGGHDAESTRAAVAFYSQVIETVVPVSSTRVAEMVKLLENTFRAVNIGLVNELALMCHRMGINVWEVIEAAKTKPFGYMPFYPGPGLGGHCIPIDPYYLSWKAKEHNFEARFIELAGQVNRSMPEHVVSLVMDALNTVQKALNGSRVHVFGVAYKKNVNDLRESPALDIMELLLRRGTKVSYTDPFFASFEHLGHRMTHEDEATAHTGKDCALIVTDHAMFDYRGIVERFPLVVDTRNALKGLDSPNIFRL